MHDFDQLSYALGILTVPVLLGLSVWIGSLIAKRLHYGHEGDDL